MRTMILMAISTCLLAPSILAASNQTALKQEMRHAGDTLTSLMPYIYNKDRFSAKENHKEVQSNIHTLISVMNKTPSLLSSHAINQLISQKVLLNQLKQAQTLYDSGSYATAQYLLSGVPIICSSCHIQDGHAASFIKKSHREHFANDYTFAEFNFYIRNYDQAKQAYQTHLNQPDVQTSRIQSTKTLERLLDVTLITQSKTEDIQGMLNTVSILKQLHPDAKAAIAQWRKGLQLISNDPQTLDQLESKVYEQFEEFFTLRHEFLFDEKLRPLALHWRTQIHRQLHQSKSKPEKAKGLYLISILDRVLNDYNELSLANLYLKQCIQLQVPGYSSKCLNEYENHLYFYYGGSAGSLLPEEASNELRQLKKSIKRDL